MRILVIGGTRFIGPRVVHRLAETGHSITVLHRGEHDSPLPEGTVSVRDPRAGIPVTAFPAQVLEFEPHVVLHMVAMGETDGRAARMAFENVARRIVMVSSGDVYRAYGYFSRLEPVPDSPPLKETSPLRTSTYPHRTSSTSQGSLEWFYDKMLAEREISASPMLAATILRLPKLYGPGHNEDLATVYGFRNHPEWRWTHGYVENVAAAIALAVLDERAKGRIYNVGEEHTPAVRERMAWLPPRPDAPLIEHPGNFDQNIVLDTSRIRSELGFAEPVPERDAMGEVISAYLAKASSPEDTL